MDKITEFKTEVQNRINSYEHNTKLQDTGQAWLESSMDNMYVYNFSWMGRPIIQTPQDILAMQEIIWEIKPDVIIETGIAHGGSIIFYASMLQLVGNNGFVIGVDIDIREHNRKEIESHPTFDKIKLIEGSSIDIKIVNEVKKLIPNNSKVLVVLDSMHTHDHVIQELNLYSPLVSNNSYLIVYDTLVEYLPEIFSNDRPWGHGNNPLTATKEFLKSNADFVLDKNIENKLVVTAGRGGYLKKVNN